MEGVGGLKEMGKVRERGGDVISEVNSFTTGTSPAEKKLLLNRRILHTEIYVSWSGNQFETSE